MAGRSRRGPSAFRGGRAAGNQYSVVDGLSFGSFGSLCSFCLAAVPAIEALDAAGGVHELLLAGKERMAARADLQPNLALGRASLPRSATRTVHACVHVFRMNVRLHFNAPVGNLSVKATRNPNR